MRSPLRIPLTLALGGLLACSTTERSPPTATVEAQREPAAAVGDEEANEADLTEAAAVAPNAVPVDAPPAPPPAPGQAPVTVAPSEDMDDRLASKARDKGEGKAGKKDATREPMPEAAGAALAQPKTPAAKPADPRSTAKRELGYVSMAESEPQPFAPSGNFDGRADARVNAFTETDSDRHSTFAIDVDTAAYSIARRSLLSNQLPVESLVRVEEFLNYFRYDYEAPTRGELFTIQADGARSPVDDTKHLLRVGIQSAIISEAERMPTNLVFLVDTSCSMTSGDKLALAKVSLDHAIDRLNARDKVAITTYAGGVRVVLPPTSGDQKRKIRQAVESLRTGGGTAMSSGLELAYRQAAAMLSEHSNTRIIVFSDGDANIGATSPDQMLKRIEGFVKEGVFLSTIGFGDGNYKDATMEQIANKGNGNYYYIDSPRQAERVFGRDFTQMVQDVAQDVKIQVEFNPETVAAYRLVGYENRDVADRDFRNDAVDAGEIGAGHQVTALYELVVKEQAQGPLATVRVRAKKPRGSVAKEVAMPVSVDVVGRSFDSAPKDFRFATAVLGGSELLRRSQHAYGWTFGRVISIVSDTSPASDPDRAEFLELMKRAAVMRGETTPMTMR